MKKVAVIGAGPAGLCMGRNLAKEPEIFEITIFEETKVVGGTWVYEDNDDPIVDLKDTTGKTQKKKDSSFHSSMYRNLRYIS